jgi:hypothetical protein
MAKLLERLQGFVAFHEKAVSGVLSHPFKERRSLSPTVPDYLRGEVRADNVAHRCVRYRHHSPESMFRGFER